MTTDQAMMGHNNPPTDAEILRETLEEKNRDLLDRAKQLIEAAERAPATIEDDETEGRITDFIKQIMNCTKSIESVRVQEKEPYLTLGRVVDGFFKTKTNDLDKAKMKVKRTLDDRLRWKAEQERKRREEEARKLREEAERQAEEAARLEAEQKANSADESWNKAINTDSHATRVQQSAGDKLAKLAQSRGSEGSMASLRTVWKGELVDRAALDLEALRQHLPQDALQQAINSFVKAGGRELKGARIFEHSESVVR